MKKANFKYIEVPEASLENYSLFFSNILLAIYSLTKNNKNLTMLFLDFSD